GPQPDVPELEPEQAFNRFNVVFKNCAHVVAQAEHPVVIFLDDLQWADPASLKLLKTIITDPGIHYLFLIGAYRDTEVDTNHILTRTLLEIEKEGVPVERIQLDSLNSETVNRFITAFFKSKEDETRSLAELVHKKTGGNPFFINQFLKTLYEEGMLEPAPFAGGWKWDMQKIEQMRVTDNVVELMAAEITRLPEIAQKMLKTCSCMGNSFDLEVIPPMVNRSIDETFSELIKVAEDGYLIISGSTGRFQHDRILEAAYSLLSEQERVRKHYNIGNYLLENIAEDEPDEKIVRIVEQLNSAISLVRLKSEQFRLIDLNLVVGKKAKGSAAYESALHHLETGITLLETDCWEDNYTRALALYSEAAEAAYLCGEYEKMETLGETVLRHAMSVRDKIKVYETRIYTYVARKMHAEAIDTGLRVLRMMGERLPRNPTMFHVILGLLRIKFTLLGKTTDDLLRLPVTRDPAAQAKMRIISVITSPTYLSRFNLMPLLIFKTIRLSIRSGNSPWSPYAYAAYGMVLCGLNDFEPGYLFGNLGINLLEKIDARQQFVNTYVAVYCFIYHWKMHAKETLAPLLKGHLTGLETGNFEFAAYAIQVYCYTLLYMGRSLEFVDWEMKKGIRVLSSLKQEMQLNMTIVNHQLAHNLQGKANDPCDVGSENINGTSMQAYFTEVGDIHAEWMIYCYQAILGWLFDKYEYAVQNADRAMENAGTMGGSFIMPMFYLFSSLAYLSRSQEADAKERKRCLRMAKKGLKKLKRWAGVVPMNNLHKLKLVEAQFAAIAKENLRAIQLYEEAIAAAHENEYIHEEAVAWECASLFYRNRGVEHIAALYLKKAHDCYSRWGALAKVSHMEKLHPELISKKAGIGNWEESTATLATATESSSENLDLYTVIKASQAISGEINLRNLLERLLVIAVENAGARKGVLLLKNEENKKLYVEAWGDYNRGMSLFQSTPFEETNLVSPAIVNYVNQTGESVVLSDAGTSGMFINDPYVIDNSSRSIICSPILDKGQMMGILFLENNIAANVFSPERLELLQILSSQAAISIQNSRLLAERENAARLETEMKIAAHIQTALLPENPAITGFEISAFLKPADAVGGDYYDVINSDENNWVIIGDVSGHGVPAGLVMMMVQASIRSYLGRHPESKPSGLLRVVNKAISYNVRRMRQDKYMTITAISFDREGRALFSGLHLDLILYRAAHKSVELVNSEGIWLSPWENLPWKDADRELHMLPGDVLLLYTDGIIEARDEKNEMFSQERLMEVFKNFAESAPTEIKEAVLAALEGFSGDDDMTMVILKRLES
ncbi:MAG: SpoIIE family protein phosphatase, partial [bacterium]|nr:SpoIIE family protein phosphatase [bacterium]